MSPLRHPRGHTPSLGPVHRLHWGHTLAQPWSERPPPQDSCTRGLTKKRVFPGYPPTLQGTHMAPLQHPWGHTPSLGPGLWQRSAAGPHFLGRPWRKCPGVTQNRCFWGSGSASLPETWAKARGVTHGCCRGAMWVPCRISGYPGKTRFLVRPRVQESWGGGRSDHG